MSRRGNIAKRDVLADPLYNSKMVTRLINNIMYDGKKGVAQKIVYDAFDIVKEKTGNDPLESFEKALENIMPVLEVWPARSWTPSTATATLAKSVRIPTRWQRPTRRLLITDINLCLNF